MTEDQFAGELLRMVKVDQEMHQVPEGCNSLE